MVEVHTLVLGSQHSVSPAKLPAPSCPFSLGSISPPNRSMCCRDDAYVHGVGELMQEAFVSV